MKKRILSFVLTIALFCCLTVPAMAAESTSAGLVPTLSKGFYDHMGVIDANGSLWMRGDNGSGQLGDGTTNNSPAAFVKIMDGVRSVSCGENYTAAVKTDGSLWMWGSNYYGVMPLEEKKVLTPKKVMDDVLSVSCGNWHIAVVKTDGSLWTWGKNEDGELGNGTKEDSSVPTRVMEDVIAVSCGGRHTAAIKSDGSLWTWGKSLSGQLGTGNTGGNALVSEDFPTVFCQTVPVKVMEGVSTVNCSFVNTTVITTDGSLWVCGANWDGQLADGAAGIARYSPTFAKVLDNVVSVSCGSNNIAAVTTDNSLWMWGAYVCGESGDSYRETTHFDGGTPLQLSPVVVMRDVSFAVCGRTNWFIAKTDGSLWGYGSKYLLDPARGEQKTPVQLPGVTVKLSSPAAVPSKVGGFNDVFETDYCAEPVRWAVEKNVTGGTSAKTFSPNATCTTAQVLTFLWRANGSPEPAGMANPFDDVKENDYYYKAALWANENGLVSGTAFNGSAPCTRAETVTYLWKLAGSPSAPAASFTDVPGNSGYAQAVAYAVSENITSGTGKTTFSPDATCTRGQIVTFLYRAYGK